MITIKIRYPSPGIDDLFDQLVEPECSQILTFQSGYHKESEGEAFRKTIFRLDTTIVNF